MVWLLLLKHRHAFGHPILATVILFLDRYFEKNDTRLRSGWRPPPRRESPATTIGSAVSVQTRGPLGVPGRAFRAVGNQERPT
jgi:hypothetical protein